VPRPQEASLAKDKGAHERINSDLDIQWRHANPRKSSRGRPELVGFPIVETSIKQIDDFVLGEWQGQATFILA
jgi:hypothetical protein